MAARRWTPEQRAQQSQAIQEWQPWNASTGPRSITGKAVSALNADQGGQRQKIRNEARQLRELLGVLNNMLLDVQRG